MTRILVCSSLICVATIACAKFAFPMLPLKQFGILAIQIPGMIGYLFVMLWISRIARERVQFYDDLILVQSGNRVYKIPMVSLMAARITMFADDKIRLRVTYQSANDVKTSFFGLDHATQFVALRNALPIPLSVRDARARYRRRFRAVHTDATFDD